MAPVLTVGVVRGSVARPRVLRPAGQPLVILASLLQLLAPSLVLGPELEAEGGHGGGGHGGRAGALLLAWGGWAGYPATELGRHLTFTFDQEVNLLLEDDIPVHVHHLHRGNITEAVTREQQLTSHR